MTDTTKEIYNKFTEFPNLAANCVEYLLNNEEMIFKLLYYTDNNAYMDNSSHPNLTLAQKRALIHSGEVEQTDYRIFLDIGQDVAWDKEACILRISPVELIPTNHIFGYLTMGFEVYSHYKINHLSDHTTRIDRITQRLIENLNGQDIQGLGRLHFNAMANSKSRSQLIGAIPFKGRGLIMCNWIA